MRFRLGVVGALMVDWFFLQRFVCQSRRIYRPRTIGCPHFSQVYADLRVRLVLMVTSRVNRPSAKRVFLPWHRMFQAVGMVVGTTFDAPFLHSATIFVQPCRPAGSLASAWTKREIHPGFNFMVLFKVNCSCKSFKASAPLGNHRYSPLSLASSQNYSSKKSVDSRWGRGHARCSHAKAHPAAAASAIA
jgi:hypothetical protein